MRFKWTGWKRGEAEGIALLLRAAGFTSVHVYPIVVEDYGAWVVTRYHLRGFRHGTRYNFTRPTDVLSMLPERAAGDAALVKVN